VPITVNAERNANFEINGCNIKIHSFDNFGRYEQQANLSDLFAFIDDHQAINLYCDGTAIDYMGTPFDNEGCVKDTQCVSWQGGSYPHQCMTGYMFSLTKNEINSIKRKLSACSNKKDKKLVVYEKEEYERNRPQREAANQSRQLCEAQKQTCLAQCEGVAVCLPSSPESCDRIWNCKEACKNISCY
jgi:hypothetical protein